MKSGIKIGSSKKKKKKKVPPKMICICFCQGHGVTPRPKNTSNSLLFTVFQNTQVFMISDGKCAQDGM
jgi:hypothetical protein